MNTRYIIAAVAVGALGLLSGCSGADTDTDAVADSENTAVTTRSRADVVDTAFVSTVSQRGIDMSSSAAIAAGHAVCETIQDGTYVGDAHSSEYLYGMAVGLSSARDLSVSDASFFIGVSIGAYCPEFGVLLE